ncbi:MAG: clan AA aspartic protease [Planctomycetota bacterium]
MGLITTKITLSNPLDTRLAPLEVDALVDTGALLLCIPDHVAVQLKLQTVQEREVSLADVQRQVCPYVGPVEVEFGNRTCFVGALVLGNEVLLGAVPMEDLDLVISPSNPSVVVNPDTPNIPGSIAK